MTSPGITTINQEAATINLNPLSKKSEVTPLSEAFLLVTFNELRGSENIELDFRTG